MSNLRKKLYNLVEVPELESDRVDRRYDWLDHFLMVLITVNVLAVVFETVPEIGGPYRSYFRWFEIFSVIVFTVEYILRIAVCTENPRYAAPFYGRLRFILTPMLLVDLLAILPFYLPMLITLDLRMLRILRILRFLRVLKFGRYSQSLQLIGRVMKAKRTELLITLVAVLLLLTLASSIMYVAENQAQPEAFSSIPKSMWWGITTLTTVGYGDVYPVTTIGKVFAAMIALLGVGIFALPAGILASGFSEEIAKPKDNDGQICPACGQKTERRET
ncbi:MAG: ion transporter [Bacteroidota bacterium]